MLLPSLTTPRIIELEELVESTKSELEDVQEHITNAAQFELSLNRIRALNLMKSGLENSTSVKVTCTEAPKELVLFNIEVHLINTEGEKSGWIIQRNYSEFMDLHQKLKAKFPSTANQYEAPSKKIFKSVLKFRKRFVETRRKALEDYLQNLLKHTEICKSVEFRLFICHSDIVRLLYSTDSVPSETKKPKTKKQFVKNLFLKFEENIKRHAVKPQSRFNSVALTSEESAAQKLKIDSNGSDTVDVLFDLITEIFELKEKGNFIRRKALNLVLQHILGGAIERRVSEGLKSIVTEDAMAMRIQSLKESIFNSVWSVRTPELKAKTRQASSSKMTHLSLALLGKVVGKKNARRGALKFLWVFQNSVLNRQLIYMILDDLLEALYT
ncbi:hypothetical protein BDR26DRAFT_866680 [Obelidium mucronatum]|nr:hypothetical protein BDR26DRAFT_866680 [Obelidium mucronatum]